MTLDTLLAALAPAPGAWPLASAVAAAALGLASVWLSPCHLVGAALAAGFLARGTRTRGAVARALIFCTAATVVLIPVVALTVGAGRLAGDTGVLATIVPVFALVLAGLMLLDLLPLPSIPAGQFASRAGWGGAAALGASFTLGTGPCSLAFVVLLLPLAANATPAAAALYLASFVTGNAAGLVAVFVAVRWIQPIFDAFTQGSAWVNTLRRMLGAALLASSAYLGAQALL